MESLRDTVIYNTLVIIYVAAAITFFIAFYMSIAEVIDDQKVPEQTENTCPQNINTESEKQI